MTAEIFLDTNILVYAVSSVEQEIQKRDVALDLIETSKPGFSAQVLQEFFVTVTRKVKTPLSHDEALKWIGTLDEFPCAAIDTSIVYRGAENAQRFGISYWDGAILAAAERLGAHTLMTEDLNHGQKYGSVTAINPFRTE